ncbi:MAG TPA: hypothetical protein VGX78_09515 [Pirellulales bacterium]|jgi:hypothetical protein|nr:hypothetical protein [Pirellulales bacterium]
MSATTIGSVLKSLEIDSARVEALSEPDLCELIGFIEYDSHLHATCCDESPPAARPTLVLPPDVRAADDASWRG